MVRTILLFVPLLLILATSGAQTPGDDVRSDPAAPAPEAEADAGRAELSMAIDGSVDAVWTAFSTKAGLAAWMAPKIEVDFRVGGTIRSHYDPAGTIGDPRTIESTILSFDPGRMISLKATGLPEGFPYAEAASHTWSVFYFEAESLERTRITIVGLGYDDSPGSRAMRGFFDAANRGLLEKLEASLRDEETSAEGD